MLKEVRTVSFRRLRFCLPFVVSLLAVCSGIAQAQGVTLYVSPRGSDSATGAKGRPLATLAGARDAIRALRTTGTLPKGGVTVDVAGGTYTLFAPLELTAADSGTANAPIIYRAAKGQTVRLTGGRTVTGFAPVTDPAVRARFDPAVRDKVVQADLKAQGITDYGAMTPRGFGSPIRAAGIELFFNDRPMPLARWPNTGFVHVTGVTSVGDRQVTSTEIAERIGRWTQEPDLWTFAYWGLDWADSYTKVAALDPAQAQLTLDKPDSEYGYKKGQRFYILNALTELDAPGEWYVDREKGILYLLPPSTVRPGSVVVSVAASLVGMTGASHITLRGFTFETCRADALRITGGTDDRIVASTLRNIGNHAIVITDGATNSGVIGCDIADTGDGGIVLTGGDRKMLTPANLFADNNQIHDYSRWCRTYRPAVAVSGVGNRVSHNLIYNGPHNGIQLSGNDHLIEFNEIHNVCYETGDVGAFYMGRDWTARGTILRNNYFHDISGPGHLGAMGIYLDDQASGITITDNLFRKVTRSVFIGGGDDNTVTNNIFVDCDPSVHLDARGLGWQKPATDNPRDTLRTSYAAMPVSDPLWRSRYPALVSAVTVGEAGAPTGNVVERNISWGGRWSDVEAAAQSGITFRNNLTDADPAFVSPAGNDFHLKASSPAFALGFKKIPLEQMGLYNSSDRATWPVVHPVKAPVRIEILEPGSKRAASRTPAPVVWVPKGKAPTIDGVLAPGEWDGDKTAAPLILEQEVGGEVVTPASRVFVRVSGGALYIAFENTLERGVPIRLGSAWGQDDAVEVALKVKDQTSAPTYVLRGFANGKFVSSPEAGASEKDAAQMGAAARYAAKVVSPSLWTAEWKIPLTAPLVVPNLTIGPRLLANFTVRKSAGPNWVQWRGTGAQSWRIDHAGILIIGVQRDLFP